MPDLTVHDVLRRLASNPAAEFRAKDVAPSHLERLRPTLTFLPDPQPGDQVACSTAAGQGCMRVVDVIGGELVAVCSCEAAEAPIPVEPEAQTSFTVDATRLARLLAAGHHLKGTPSAVTPRCHYLGQTEIEGQRIGVVLGLFDDRDAVNELRALPGVLPVPVDETLCITPVYAPPPDVERQLAAIRVRTALLDRFDPEQSLTELLRAPTRTVPLMTLTDEQERGLVAAGFLCRWPIVVTGRLAKGGANVVEINGQERRLGRAAFPLFMRLLAGLFETENGFVPVGKLRSGGGLAAEGYYTADGAYQAIGRLREALRDFGELVEVGGGAVRLSTHPGYVHLDHELLTKHRDTRVRDLSARMRAASTNEVTAS